MNWKKELKPLAWIVAGFLVFFFLPVGGARFDHAVLEAFHLAKWYAREHVLLCLVPAFFIAGAIGVFVSQTSVMKYLGANASKFVAYSVASISGTVLAVCSCTVLPLFGGIYRMGAGLGPATAFLYSGPAINALAIILTARILGMQLGIARAVGAILFSVIIGLSMHFIFRKEEAEKAAVQAAMPEEDNQRPLWKTAIYFGTMMVILIFANWGPPNSYDVTLKDGRTVRAAILHFPGEPDVGDNYELKILDSDDESGMTVGASFVISAERTPSVWTTIWKAKWIIASAGAIVFSIIMVLWFGIPWWKMCGAAIPPTVLAFTLPMDGMLALLPFGAGIIGLTIVLGSEKGEPQEWLSTSWIFAKQILPLLIMGVLIAGFLLGKPGSEGMIPAKYVQMLVGDTPDAFFAITGMGDSGIIRAIWPVWTNFFASVFGAFMYFATLTEVPILQGLIGAGMGKGPALALLLAGPALSLPNMLVIRSIMGTKKTAVFVSLVVVLSTLAGLIFGAIV
jgi:uncharacterized membrane protein YraQ (UPF0718 family)